MVVSDTFAQPLDIPKLQKTPAFTSENKSSDKIPARSCLLRQKLRGHAKLAAGVG
jgi:hypothetical protein